MVIYKITNTKNRKIYIGKSTTDTATRWELHLKHAFQERRKTRFCNALRKYGSDAFIQETIVDGITTNNTLNEQEVLHIKEANSTDPSVGYNMSVGGDGGFTKEMRQQSIEVRKQNGISPEHQQALIEGRKRAGYAPKTDEQKQAISDSVKQYYQDHPDHLEHITSINRKKALSGTEHPMWGKTHTQGARDKMSKARAGRTYTEIYGEDKAENLKMHLRQQTGNKNPNYSNIDQSLLVTLAANPRITRQAICSELGCSGPTLTKRFRKLLRVENLQKFRYNKTDTELKIFFEEVLHAFLHRD